MKYAFEHKDLIIIDEIGPMEILSDRFRKVVLEILDRDVLVLGTIARRQTDFTETVKTHPSVQVIEITRANHDQVVVQILAMLRKTCRCEVVSVEPEDQSEI
jgi:nucleoside-triphosphatase